MSKTSKTAAPSQPFLPSVSSLHLTHRLPAANHQIRPHSCSKPCHGSPVPSGLQLNSLAGIHASERAFLLLEPQPSPLPYTLSSLHSWTRGPDSASGLSSPHLLPPARFPSDDPHLSNYLDNCFSGSHLGAGMWICFPPAAGPCNQGSCVLPGNAYFTLQNAEASPDPQTGPSAQFSLRPRVPDLGSLSHLHIHSPVPTGAWAGVALRQYRALPSPSSSTLRVGMGQKPRLVERLRDSSRAGTGTWVS